LRSGGPKPSGSSATPKPFAKLSHAEAGRRRASRVGRGGGQRRDGHRRDADARRGRLEPAVQRLAQLLHALRPVLRAHRERPLQAGEEGARHAGRRSSVSGRISSCIARTVDGGGGIARSR
jgi:hypothetical protein